MTITLSSAARSAAADAVVDLVDGGTADATGDLVGYTSGDVEVFRCAMSNAAFGNAVTGVATAAAISDDTSAAGGDLTGGYHAVENRDNTEIWRGSVGTSGADLNLSSLNIGVGETVTISAYTYTQPAS